MELKDLLVVTFSVKPVPPAPSKRTAATTDAGDAVAAEAEAAATTTGRGAST
jgi:hypothetical protein